MALWSNWFRRSQAQAVIVQPQAGAGSLDGVLKQWLNQDAYKGTGAQFDETAPPVELPIYGAPPAVLISAVQAAILQLEQGAFYASSYLADGMTRDERIAAKSEERIDRVVGADLDLEPGKETAKGRKVVDDFKLARSKLIPAYQQADLMRYGLWLSVGIAQIMPSSLDPSSPPTFQVWNPRNLRYDQLLRRYRLVTQNKGEISLEFVNGVDYSDGAFSWNGDEYQPTRWIVYEPFGPRGWLHGAKIRSLIIPFCIRYWSRTWWARYQEVHGQPIRAGIIPAERKPKDEALFLAQLSNLAHEAVIRLPQGEEGNKFDVKLIEAAANSWQGFQQLLAHCDDSIAITFLGQSQSTKGQGGLGTQEDAGESTMVRISRRDALIGTILRDQHLKAWAQDHYGDADCAPFLNFQVAPPEDDNKAAKTLLAIGQALVQFKAAGAPLDMRATMEEAGLKVLSEADHLKQKQQALEDAQAMLTATTPEESTDDESDQEDDAGDDGAPSGKARRGKAKRTRKRSAS
jgi:hypothetical protein